VLEEIKMRFDDISNEFKEQFDEMAKSAQKIAITSHIHPDDDSIGSTLSVYYYLTENLGIAKSRTDILYTGEGPERYERFPGYNKIRFVRDIAEKINEYDLLIITDASGWHRVSVSKGIENYKGKRIAIDHHPTAENQHNLHLLAPQYTSTCEIIYKQFFDIKNISKPEAEAILLGILGDTGNFRFISGKRAGVLTIAKEIIEKFNINIDEFKSGYDYVSLESLKVLARLINNIKVVKIGNWPPFLYSVLDLEYAASSGDESHILSEGKAKFIDYLKAIKDVGWGFVVVPRAHNTCTISFRSEPGSVNVRLVAEKMQIGSGHDHASGATISVKDPKDAANMIINWLENNSMEE